MKYLRGIVIFCVGGMLVVQLVAQGMAASRQDKADKVERKPVRIVWTGASFVPKESASLTAKLVNQGKNGFTVVDSHKLFGSPRILVKEAAKFKEGKFDYAVLNSIVLAVLPRDEKRVQTTKEEFAAAIKLCRSVGTKPILYCTWLRSTSSKPRPGAGTMEKDFDLFASHYESMAKEHGACLAPIGHSWKVAWVEQSEEKLGLYRGDINHASPRGLYLNACVMYCVLTGKSPVGDTTFGLPGMNLDKKTAALLQEVAWKTFQKQRARKDIKVCVLD